MLERCLSNFDQVYFLCNGYFLQQQTSLSITFDKQYFNLANLYY